MKSLLLLQTLVGTDLKIKTFQGVNQAINVLLL